MCLIYLVGNVQDLSEEAECLYFWVHGCANRGNLSSARAICLTCSRWLKTSVAMLEGRIIKMSGSYFASMSELNVWIRVDR